MKILKALMVVGIVLFSSVWAHAGDYGFMRISLIEGDVQIKTADVDAWGDAALNDPLGEGDQIWVPEDGRVELQLKNGAFVRLDEFSSLQILSVEKDSSQLYLSQGYAYIYNDAPDGNVLQVDTPDVSTRVFNMAVYRIDLSDSYTDVSVFKGYVETENRRGTIGISAGRMLSLGPDSDGDLFSLEPPDRWERWNTKRDRWLADRESASTRYLPPGLETYSRDFDDNGRWVRDPRYGFVWVPRVDDSDWAPYRNGRWVSRGGDYIWVGIEPWGWAPYHYGRWSFLMGIGWAWVPPVRTEVYWSPGYVGWVRTPTYVAWVPLAPGEIYFGKGYYGRDSINIAKADPRRIRVTRNYLNVTINNSVTIVNTNAFISSSPRPAYVRRNDIRNRVFTRENICIGAPPIKPSRASYFVTSRPVPETKRPPSAIRNIQTTQLRHARPFIREKDKSVWNPGKRPQFLPVNPGSGHESMNPMGNSDDSNRRRPNDRRDRRRFNADDRKPDRDDNQRPNADDRKQNRDDKPRPNADDRKPDWNDKQRSNSDDRKPGNSFVRPGSGVDSDRNKPASSGSGVEDRRNTNRFRPEDKKDKKPELADDKTTGRDTGRRVTPEEVKPDRSNVGRDSQGSRIDRNTVNPTGNSDADRREALRRRDEERKKSAGTFTISPGEEVRQRMNADDVKRDETPGRTGGVSDINRRVDRNKPATAAPDVKLPDRKGPERTAPDDKKPAVTDVKKDRQGLNPFESRKKQQDDEDKKKKDRKKQSDDGDDDKKPRSDNP